jgi:taurine dioxygenase
MLIHPTGRFDNSAVLNRHIEVRPLAAAMGAEICGVDVEHVTDDQFQEIRAALFRHKMVFFRGQRLSHGGQQDTKIYPFTSSMKSVEANNSAVSPCY